VEPPGWVAELALGRGARWPVMGVHADDGDWPAAADPTVLALRRRLAAENPDCIAALPGSDGLVAEVVGRFGGGDLAGLATAQGDDVCLLAADGRWTLVAGAVLFPSHWRLADKLGRPLAEVHDRVPGYPASQVDRFLDRLKPGQVVWRRNLLVHRDGELHAPVARTDDVPVAEWWLRSERQTLRLLPATGGALFTIHTDVAPLADLDAATRGSLADHLAGLPSSWAEYAGVADQLAELVGWLRQ
jgi:dimethylamine monooxygenase subunit A